MQEKGSINIYDVAERAGVSIATVSRVISGSDKVSQRTRQRVLEVIEDTSYVPNAFARGLGSGSMKLVGILCTDVSDIYYARAVSILEGLLAENDLNSLLYCTGQDPARKGRGLDTLLSKRVDAVILVGSPFVEEDNSHILQVAAQVPVFCVNGYVEGDGVYCVLCDEEQAMHRSASLLMDQGCRRILYLYDADTYSGRTKIAGYRRAVEERTEGAAEDLVLRVSRDFGEIAALVEALLDSGPPFDGVLASEDILAVGACKVLARRGLELPVIGFNNSVLAVCATPALTSMDNMVETLCATSVDLLVQVLGGKQVPQKITVSARLVERETFQARGSGEG